jgi:hypothetical protein
LSQEEQVGVKSQVEPGMRGGPPMERGGLGSPAEAGRQRARDPTGNAVARRRDGLPEKDSNLQPFG